ncbi:MAG: oligosaccharide flippase family protein [Ornithinimicrobium sp.]
MSTEGGIAAPPSTSLDRAARGSVLNFAGSGVAAVATLLTTVVVTQLTSQTQAGIFFVATSFFLLASALGQLGTNTGLVYFLSGSRARGELDKASGYMRIASRPVLVVAVLMAIVVAIAAQPIAEVFSAERSEEFARHVRVMAIFIPCAAVLYLALAGTRGLGTMKVNASVDQMARPLLQLGLVALGIVVLGPQAAPGAWAAAYLPLAIVGWWWWRRLSARAAPQSHSSRLREARPFWAFTAPRALAGLAQVAMQRLDIILVGSLAGLPAAAIYAAATRFLSLGQMAARAVSLSAQPLLGEALARGDRRDAQQLYQASTVWLILVAWPLYLVLIVFGSEVLTVFGPGYSAGDTALLILCSAMLIATSCGMVDMVLTMAGKSLWNLGNVLLAFTVNLGLDLILIPQIGIVGAAIGWASAIVAANLVPLTQIALAFKLHPFGAPTLVSMTLAAGCFVGVPLAFDALVDTRATAISVGLGSSVLLYLVVLVLLRRFLALDVLARAIRRRGKGKGADALS